MASYIPKTPQERADMLKALGFDDMEALFAHIPNNLRAGALEIPAGLNEADSEAAVEELAAQNRVFTDIFLGAGAYDHYIPPVVSQLSEREEFVTAYTPYQAELSQGILQSIFEYQTMICSLLDMDVANASVYDGGTAAGEAVLMCAERKKNTVLVSDGLNPQMLDVVKTYCNSYGFCIKSAHLQDGKTVVDAWDDDVFALLFAQPNFLGQIEDAEALCALAHKNGAKAIMSVHPIAMAMLQTPGEAGADIAVGEGQPLGMPLSFGGPYLGFMAATSAMMRKLPGRIVGQTEDASGKTAYVLTLQAREQHIKRERASSSICSNQAQCALKAGMYLAAMGPQGLLETAENCYYNAHYLAKRLEELAGFEVLCTGEFFMEFVTKCPVPTKKIVSELAKRGILAGYPLDEEDMLWCATEKCTKPKIDRLIEALEELL